MKRLSLNNMLEIVFGVATIFLAVFYCLSGQEMLRCIGMFFGICFVVFYLESKEEGLGL